MTWTTRGKTPLEFILLESGDFLLLETGDFIYLEQIGAPDTYWNKRLKA